MAGYPGRRDHLAKRTAGPLGPARILRVLVLLLIFLAALVFVCMCAGPTGAGSLHVMKGILSASLEPPDKNIIYSLRLPRILLVGVVGAALFLAGVVFQAVLRNPLAEPYVLGVWAEQPWEPLSESWPEHPPCRSVYRNLHSSGAMLTVVLVFGIARTGKRDQIQHDYPVGCDRECLFLRGNHVFDFDHQQYRSPQYHALAQGESGDGGKAPDDPCPGNSPGRMWIHLLLCSGHESSGHLGADRLAIGGRHGKDLNWAARGSLPGYKCSSIHQRHHCSCGSRHSAYRVNLFSLNG